MTLPAGRKDYRWNVAVTAEADASARRDLAACGMTASGALAVYLRAVAREGAGPVLSRIGAVRPSPRCDVRASGR